MDKNKKTMLQKVENGIKSIRKNIWYWILYVFSTSVIGLIITSLVCKTEIKEQLKTVNLWVGIILGLIALMASIVSLILSFYNLEKGNELTTKTDETLNKILEISTRTNMTLDKVAYRNSGLMIDKIDKSPEERKKVIKDVEGELNEKP